MCISFGDSWISDPLSLVSFHFQGIEFLRNKWCVSNICDLLYTEAALINIIYGTFPVYKIIVHGFFPLHLPYTCTVCTVCVCFYNIVSCLLHEVSYFLILFFKLIYWIKSESDVCFNKVLYLATLYVVWIFIVFHIQIVHLERSK